MPDPPLSVRGPSHATLRRMRMNHEFNFRWEDPVTIRSCQYLNTIVEQDHLRKKIFQASISSASQLRPELYFDLETHACRLILAATEPHCVATRKLSSATSHSPA
jgi:transposase-like protein